MIGKNIRKYRETAGISQESLATSAKLHSNYISLLERGGANVSAESIERIAKALKIAPHLLLIPESYKGD
ncbi:MAG TPA: helix-turn-helix transcriptional regulator [Candidatus Kapabacteria bacterium]|nr:helix-turn-helix transcriptional regulator [Candidatus Kapabacteria bacterium]